ncbi:hypothetical protein N203_00425 [Helicobacter pylori UM084]|nr:hypothetical protein N203_00425 [Helicobacter pylori UM084]
MLSKLFDIKKLLAFLNFMTNTPLEQRLKTLFY